MVVPVTAKDKAKPKKDYSGFPEELRPYLLELSAGIDLIMTGLEQDKITPSEWEDHFQALLADFMVLAFAAGAGHIAQDHMVDSITEMIGDQYDYLSNFKSAIVTTLNAGGAWLPAWNSRGQLYVDSLVSPYWMGKTEGLPLPVMPGQASQCGERCYCGWLIDWVDKDKGDADCYWLLNQQGTPKENCQTCVERAKQWNPIRVRDWRLIVPAEERNKEFKHLAGKHDQKTHGHRFHLAAARSLEGAKRAAEKVGIAVADDPAVHTATRQAIINGAVAAVRAGQAEAIPLKIDGKISGESTVYGDLHGDHVAKHNSGYQESYIREYGRYFTQKLHPEILRRAQKFSLLADRNVRNWIKQNLSIRAASNAQELAAEAYAAWKLPDFKKLSPQTRAFVTDLMTGKKNTKEVTASYKHLPGQHNQKRHGWRYGGLNKARRSLRNNPAPGEREEYRKRAGIPDATPLERKEPIPKGKTVESVRTQFKSIEAKRDSEIASYKADHKKDSDRITELENYKTEYDKWYQEEYSGLEMDNTLKYSRLRRDITQREMRHEITSEEARSLMRQSFNDDIAESKALREKYKDKFTEATNNAQERQTLKAKESKATKVIEDRATAAAREALKADTPSTITPEIKFTAKDPRRAIAQEGTDFVNSFFEKSVVTSNHSITIKADGRRSNADQAGLYIDKYSDSSVVAHEYGHWIERNHPEVKAKVQAFLARRTQGEPARWLGRGYGRSEQAKADKFIVPYMGKIYHSGDTEVLSMGIQYMHEKPFEFASKDPDYFDFIYNLSKGKG